MIFLSGNPLQVIFPVHLYLVLQECNKGYSGNDILEGIEEWIH